MKRALVLGSTGQDGSYMMELLLEKGYEVHGLVRRTSHDATQRINHILGKVNLIVGDLADQTSLNRAVSCARPDEVYNLAAQSYVGEAWNQPIYTGDVTGLGVTRLLEAVKHHAPKARFYQASSSEMFGSNPPPQSENTPFSPCSPYGVAKAYGHYITRVYRESYKTYAVSGICFNHESPRRGIEFVSRKITHTLAKIKLGLQDKIILGNLTPFRDWGFAGDYVKAMWLMLQQDEPRDYVISTGQKHTVLEFLNESIKYLGLDIDKCVEISQDFFRPNEVKSLQGDSTAITSGLDWKPTVNLEQLVKMMIDSDMELLSENKHG